MRTRKWRDGPDTLERVPRPAWHCRGFEPAGFVQRVCGYTCPLRDQLVTGKPGDWPVRTDAKPPRCTANVVANGWVYEGAQAAEDLSSREAPRPLCALAWVARGDEREEAREYPLKRGARTAGL